MDNDNTTVKEMRKILQVAMRKKGGAIPICPCCNRKVKLYRRKLNKNMTGALVHIYRETERHPELDYIEVPVLLKRSPRPWGRGTWGGDYAKLRYWGLLEQKPGIRNDGSKRNGFWRITELGKQFVREQVRVASHAFDFNSECFGLDDSVQLSIRGILEFNYEELMQS